MVEWEMMSLYGAALGVTLYVYHFAMSSEFKHDVLSNGAILVPARLYRTLRPVLHLQTAVVNSGSDQQCRFFSL